jgi:hypothetical protein
MSPLAIRTLTLFAVAVLAFDGAALVGLGLWGGRTTLTLLGLGFFLSSGLVLVYWRWYRRRLDDIVAARRVLSQEAREVERLLDEG